MSNARSSVLGKDVKAGEVDSNKIDGATGGAGLYRVGRSIYAIFAVILTFFLDFRHEHGSSY